MRTTRLGSGTLFCLFTIFAAYPFEAASQQRVQTAAPPNYRPAPQEIGAVSGEHDTVTASESDAPKAGVLIGGGDLLQISVYGVPDFNQQVRVGGDGTVTLPLIGELRLSGLSASQAETFIGHRLKEGGFFKNPQVSVLDREFATQGVSVLGEVQKPGIYPVLGPRKLFDVISQAGGTAPTAGRDILVTHRSTPQDVQKVSLYEDTTKMMVANVDVYPGDTVVVSKAGIVYVVGDVKQPGGFVLDKNKELTILQALALAQGANTTASLNHSKLIHRSSSGVVETPVYLKKIVDGKEKDLTLQPDDVLFIPHSESKEAMTKGLQTVLQTAAGVAIYRF